MRKIQENRLYLSRAVVIRSQDNIDTNVMRTIPITVTRKYDIVSDYI